MITWPYEGLHHKITQHGIDLFYPGGNRFNSRVDFWIVYSVKWNLFVSPPWTFKDEGTRFL